MAHRDPHRRTPVSLSSLGNRLLSPIFLRVLFTVLALLVWLFWVMPAFAQAPEPTPTTVPTELPASHTVQAGETLSEIAKQYGLVIEQLMRLNGIPNPDAVFVGQVLRLPVLDRPEGVTVHVVRSGESLSVIARQYGVPMNLLMEENGIRNANNIVSGMELVVPPVSPTPTTASTTGSAIASTTPALVTANGEPVIGEPEVMSVHTRTPAPPTLIVVPTSTSLPTAAPTELPATATPTPESIEDTAEEPATGPVPDATLENGLWVHIVRPGETASEIAREYGVALTTLLRTNGIADANLIRSGANLVIPGSNAWTPGAVPENEAASSASEMSATEPAVGEPVVGEPVILEAMTPTLAASATPVPTEAVAEPTATLEALPTEPLASESLATDALITDALITDALITEIATPAPLSDRPASSLNRTYNIVVNDTLPGIALRFGVDVDSLARLNNLERNSPLRAGTSLLLPATDRELRVVSDAQEYVVKPGDSLSAIAKSHGVTLAELMSANRIVNPNIVSVGERLEIPGRALVGDGPMQRVGPARSGYYFYTVRSGDTLSELAANLNSTEIALMEYNNISDAATIFNGMELRVPFGAPPLPKRTPPVPLSGSSFLVSLSRQQCWVFSGREVRYAWNCSTGYGQWRTRTGSFAVQSKIEMAKSNVWRLDMPYWLGIYDVGAVENGIHGLPISWRTGRKIWTELIGEPATFGCAMLGDEDALTLFNLAYLGMPVHIIQ